MPNARARCGGGPRFNLKRPRNLSPDGYRDISGSLRYTKRYRTVYELDSDDELVERIHISSDAELEDDVNPGRIMNEEIMTEIMEDPDVTVNPMPMVDEVKPTDSSRSEKSRGKKREDSDQDDTKNGEIEQDDLHRASGHAGLDDNVGNVKDIEGSVYEEKPTTQREPMSAGEHEHHRHLRLYHTTPPPNSYDSSTGTFYNTDTSGSSSSTSERDASRESEETEATTLRVPRGGKSLQALMTVVPIEWIEEQNELEIPDGCNDEAESVDDDSEEEAAVVAQISAVRDGTMIEHPQVNRLPHEVENWFRSFLGDDALNPFVPTEFPDTYELSGLLEPNHEFGIDLTGASSFTWPSGTDEATLPIQRLDYE